MQEQVQYLLESICDIYYDHWSQPGKLHWYHSLFHCFQTLHHGYFPQYFPFHFDQCRHWPATNLGAVQTKIEIVLQKCFSYSTFHFTFGQVGKSSCARANCFSSSSSTSTSSSIYKEFFYNVIYLIINCCKVSFFRVLSKWLLQKININKMLAASSYK